VKGIGPSRVPAVRGSGPTLTKPTKGTLGASPRRVAAARASKGAAVDAPPPQPAVAGSASSASTSAGPGGTTAPDDKPRVPRPDDYLSSVRMDREQRQRMAMIDSALEALKAGFVGDRGSLATPGEAGTDRAPGSVSGRSAVSAATVSRGVRRQDIVVATVRAREQVPSAPS
jgi:hypothetical protein